MISKFDMLVLNSRPQFNSKIKIQKRICAIMLFVLLTILFLLLASFNGIPSSQYVLGPGDGSDGHCELLHISGDNITLDSVMTQYPHPHMVMTVYGYIAGVVNHQYVVCGGAGHQMNVSSNQCFSYNSKTQKWEAFASLQK